MLRDENRQIYNTLDAFSSTVASPTAFNGGTSNARGNSGGTNDPFTLFTITGDVELAIYGVCTTDLISAGGGSLSLGLTDNTTLFIASTTATTIDANEIWVNTTPAIGVTLDSLNFFIVANGEDIVEDTLTANITAGNIYYVCLWRPLTSGSSVVSAV